MWNCCRQLKDRLGNRAVLRHFRPRIQSLVPPPEFARQKSIRPQPVIKTLAIPFILARLGQIHDQKWILVLTGAVDVHLRGGDGGQLEQEVQILPDIVTPCHYAINNYSIPRPTGVEGSQCNPSRG